MDTVISFGSMRGPGFATVWKGDIIVRYFRTRKTEGCEIGRIWYFCFRTKTLRLEPIMIWLAPSPEPNWGCYKDAVIAAKEAVYETSQKA